MCLRAAAHKRRARLRSECCVCNDMVKSTRRPLCHTSCIWILLQNTLTVRSSLARSLAHLLHGLMSYDASRWRKSRRRRRRGSSMSMSAPANLIHTRIMIMLKYYCQKYRRGTVQRRRQRLQWIWFLHALRAPPVLRPNGNKLFIYAAAILCII